MNADSFKADIPFTAQVIKHYFDGTKEESTLKGVYKGVAVEETTVTYGPEREISPEMRYNQVEECAQDSSICKI